MAAGNLETKTMSATMYASESCEFKLRSCCCLFFNILFVHFRLFGVRKNALFHISFPFLGTRSRIMSLKSWEEVGN